MKAILSAILINVALFFVSVFLYVVIVSLLGYASDDSDRSPKWILFAVFALIHLLIFWVIARRRKEFKRKFTVSGIVTIGVLYGALVVDSFFG